MNRSRDVPGPRREVSPLAVFRAGRVEFAVTEVVPWHDVGEPVTPLEMYGAAKAPDFSGWWVYAFADPGGKVFRVGQSERLWSRWRDYYYEFGARFTAADKWLVKVANEAEADLVELLCIRFYEPECNDKGRASDLAAKVRAWGRGTRQFRGNQPPLDLSQATD